jgi:hypothetical protein
VDQANGPFDFFFGVTFRSLTLGHDGLVDPADLAQMIIVLDDLEAEVASGCPLGAPEILSPPATAVTSLDAGATFSIAWSPAAGLREDGTYVVELSQDCRFSTLLSSATVSGTSADLVVPPAAAGGVLYVRVYATETCGSAGILRGPGSARVIEVKKIVREPILTVPAKPLPRTVSR